MNTDQQTEEWAKVPGYPDYEVSSLGGVRPIVARCKKNATGLNPCAHKGYRYVMLKGNTTGIYKNLRVHRLVASAFIPNAENLPCINHRDGNKSNNVLNNLEWCTQKQNVHHAIKIGLLKNRGEDQWMHVLKSAQVIDIVASRRAGVSGASLSRKYGVSQTNICAILAGRRWSSVTGIQKTL